MTAPRANFICSLCRRRIPDDGIVREVLIDGCSRPGGRYCSPDCVEAAGVVDAVRDLQRDDEVADLLLALWRRGRGPKPAIVAEAVRRASRQKAAVASTP